MFPEGTGVAWTEAELTVFALIRNDGFWWESEAGGTGSRELCHTAMTSVKFTAALPILSAGAGGTTNVSCGLQGMMGMESYFSLELMGGKHICLYYLKAFGPILSFQ
jgi:hypothetical protein